MLDTIKKWIYTGSNHGLEFDDIPIPVGQEANIPDSLKPTHEMQKRFRETCADMGIMEFV